MKIRVSAVVKGMTFDTTHEEVFETVDGIAAVTQFYTRVGTLFPNRALTNIRTTILEETVVPVVTPVVLVTPKIQPQPKPESSKPQTVAQPTVVTKQRVGRPPKNLCIHCGRTGLRQYFPVNKKDPSQGKRCKTCCNIVNEKFNDGEISDKTKCRDTWHVTTHNKPFKKRVTPEQRLRRQKASATFKKKELLQFYTDPQDRTLIENSFGVDEAATYLINQHYREARKGLLNIIDLNSYVSEARKDTSFILWFKKYLDAKKKNYKTQGSQPLFKLLNRDLGLVSGNFTFEPRQLVMSKKRKGFTK